MSNYDCAKHSLDITHSVHLDTLENTWTPEMTYQFDDRIQFMLGMAQGLTFQSFMDLGCGNQDAKTHLPIGIEYIPINYIDQCPGTIVRDFNKGEFYECKVDLMFGSGILEYIYEPLLFLQNVSQYCHKYFLLSYVLGEYRKEKAKIWVNSLTRDELLALLYKVGFELIREEWYKQDHQKIFLLRK